MCAQVINLSVVDMKNQVITESKKLAIVSFDPDQTIIREFDPGSG